MDLITLEKSDKFDDIYSDMCTQFPRVELKTYQRFRELFNNPCYELYVAKSKEKPAGYVIFFNDVETKTIWVDYIAVFKEFHSQGFGHKIFSALKSYFCNLYGCWLEVEKPSEKDINTLRRIKFYKSLGAVKTSCNYLYPNENGYLPMDLYFMPFGDKVFHFEKEKYTAIENAFSTLHSELGHTDDILKLISK